MSAHHIARHLASAARQVRKSENADNPVTAAAFGAGAAGAGIPAVLATVGFALTPLGWVVALGAGAAAGATYFANRTSRD